MNLPKRCVDLDEDHIDEGLKSVETMRVLLEHMARISKPNEGAAKILVAISRIATTACEWLEGTLHVEVDEVIGASEIKVMSDLGGGFRELMFPRLVVDVEYEELVRAVKLAPRLVTPLKYRVKGARMILKREVAGTVAPPAFEISEESLRRSLSPKLRRSLPPIQPSASRAMEEPTVEGSILGRLFPKATRTLVIDDFPKLDVGWDLGAYSSTINTRETKPPPPAKTPSRMPTRPPPAEEAAPPKPAPRASKAPPKPPTKPTSKPTSKAPPKPTSNAPTKPPKPSTKPTSKPTSKAPTKPSTRPSKAPEKPAPKPTSKAPPKPASEAPPKPGGRRPIIRKIGKPKPA